MMKNDAGYVARIREYCRVFNIPFEFLADVLYEPKVVPMIRGKAFEFSVMTALKTALPKGKWLVEKEPLNAQLGFHDRDVKVTHKKSGKVLSVECKLAKNNSFRPKTNSQIQISVKCMRSRTLGPEKIKALAPQLKQSEAILKVHNDQYLPGDFDLVITSIGNAFYKTSSDSGMYEWQPTDEGVGFLTRFSPPRNVSLKDFAFDLMYVARSQDLFVSPKNRIVCTRQKCKHKTNCGFIPNYPIITFDSSSGASQAPWVQLMDSAPLFESLLSE